jgi:hypothetical protein
MLTAASHGVHIDPNRSHSGMENSCTILLQGHQRVNPIPEDERDDAF